MKRQGRPAYVVTNDARRRKREGERERRREGERGREERGREREGEREEREGERRRERERERERGGRERERERERASPGCVGRRACDRNPIAFVVQGRQRAGIEEGVRQRDLAELRRARPAQQHGRGNRLAQAADDRVVFRHDHQTAVAAGLPQDRLDVQRLDGRHVQHGQRSPGRPPAASPSPAPAWS